MRYVLRLSKKEVRSRNRGMSVLRRFRSDEVDGDDALKNMQDKIDALKLGTPSRPSTDVNPELPKDITRISDDELGRLHAQYAAMAQYVGYNAALKAVEHAAARRLERLTRARVRLEKSGTVDDKAAQVEADIRTEKASLKLLVAEGAEALVNAHLQAFVIGRETTSREMTRRMSLIPPRSR